MSKAVSSTQVQALILESGIRYKDYKQVVYDDNQVVREECITAIWRNIGNVPVYISDCIRLYPGETHVIEGSMHVQCMPNGVVHIVPIRKIIDTTVRWDYPDIAAVEEPDKRLALILTDIQYPQ